MEAARKPLSRDRILRTAVELADERGIEALTMRNLGQELGVEAMSLYNHVSNKDDLLDGVVDVVGGELVAAVDGLPGGEWKATMRAWILAARGVMLRHRWAPAVLETRRQPPPSIMRYYDSLLGLMLGGGFSMDLAHHAMHALGSRALGFSQELFVTDDDDVDPDVMAVMIKQTAAVYPNMAELMKVVFHDPETTLGGCDDQFEFEFGLDLLLDGLERLRDREWQVPERA